MLDAEPMYMLFGYGGSVSLTATFEGDDTLEALSVTTVFEVES